MEYYKQKRILNSAIEEWLKKYVDAELPPDTKNITDFVNKMALQTGFGTKTIKKQFHLFGNSIDDDKMVKL
jgi:hypothetical protein